MARKLKKPLEGEKLPETPDFQAWKKEFESMSKDEHKQKLLELGLDDEEIEEWEEMEEDDIPLEEEILEEGPIKEKAAAKTVTKAAKTSVKAVTKSSAKTSAKTVKSPTKKITKKK